MTGTYMECDYCNNRVDIIPGGIGFQSHWISLQRSSKGDEKIPSGAFNFCCDLCLSQWINTQMQQIIYTEI